MFCRECEKKPTCKKICSKVNKHLKSQGIYSADFIRPEVSSAKRREERKHGIYKSKYREIPFSSIKDRNYDGDLTPDTV